MLSLLNQVLTYGYFLPNKQALIYQSIIKSYLAILYVASFKGNSVAFVYLDISVTEHTVESVLFLQV